MPNNISNIIVLSSFVSTQNGFKKTFYQNEAKATNVQQDKKDGAYGRTAYLYLLSQEGRLKVRFDHHLHLQFGAPHLTYQGDDTERQDNVLSGSVPGGK